jgi:hypothetical protein
MCVHLLRNVLCWTLRIVPFGRGSVVCKASNFTAQDTYMQTPHARFEPRPGSADALKPRDQREGFQHPPPPRSSLMVRVINSAMRMGYRPTTHKSTTVKTFRGVLHPPQPSHGVNWTGGYSTLSCGTSTLYKTWGTVEVRPKYQTNCEYEDGCLLGCSTV